MNVWEIVLLALVCIAFAVAVGVIVYNKIKGKSSCDCRSINTKNSNGCDGCCAHCVQKQKDNK